MPAAAARLLVTIPAAADALSLSRRHVYRLISDGRLRSVCIGRRRLIPRSALEEFVQRLALDSARERAAVTVILDEQEAPPELLEEWRSQLSEAEAYLADVKREFGMLEMTRPAGGCRC